VALRKVGCKYNFKYNKLQLKRIKRWNLKKAYST